MAKHNIIERKRKRVGEKLIKEKYTVQQGHENLDIINRKIENYDGKL